MKPTQKKQSPTAIKPEHNRSSSSSSKSKSNLKKENRNNGVINDEEANKIDQDIAEKEMRYPQM